MYLYLAFIGIMTALFIGTIGINRIIDILESKLKGGK